MTPTPAYTRKFLKKRKFLLALPFLVTPFLFFLFYSLGGGGSTVPTPATNGPTGFNPELPKARFDRKKKEPDKLEYYKKADEDSLRRKEYLQQDPYRGRTFDSTRPFYTNASRLPAEDPKADELLKKLDQLRQSIQPPASYPDGRSIQQSPSYPDSRPTRQAIPYPGNGSATNPDNSRASERSRLQQALPSIQSAGTSDEDPQLQKLNSMLDKIIRIQHPGEEPSANAASQAASASSEASSIPGTPFLTGVHPAPATTSNAIPATIPEDQTLVAGATIALRLTETARISGVVIPKEQWVYGVVSINNDRMLINIHSIRHDHSIYSTDLQVYDMDGLPGIHIPGALNREVAKQSADQGISSVNLTTFDPSLGAQATNAGIQAAKTLLSRKVKQIRVTVRSGYQVLLHNAKAVSFSKPLLRSPIPVDTASLIMPPANTTTITPPENPPLPAFLHHTVTAEKMSLTLQGIYLQKNILWFSFLLYNDGPIDYVPEYARWTIRDRHQLKRTAVQDLPLSPVYAPSPPAIPGYSNRRLIIGFQPFALARDKELVWQIGEKNGARVLMMTIGHHEILRAKMQAP